MKKEISNHTAVFPMPVLMIATYDENGTVDVMNAAWGMNNSFHYITLFIDENHKTTQNIRLNKAFTVSLADQEHIQQADFFGMASGNKMADKFEHTGFHAIKSSCVNAPIIEEFPIVMECELAEIIETEHLHAIVGRIVKSQADERVLDANGTVDAAKLGAVAYDSFQRSYYTIGSQIGKAWNIGAGLLKK